MRRIFGIIFLLMIVALGVCAVTARRSRKAIGRSVSLLVAALIPPVIGNLMIIVTGNAMVADVGRYIYFLGMDLVMYALLQFTFDYCHLKWPSAGLKATVYFALLLDVIQLMCNPLFGHAFGSEKLTVDGFAYYRLVPYFGQTFHRVVDYAVFGAVLIIFVVKMVRAPRIYSERYTALLAAMVAGGLWQTFYIFSRSPIDRSMLGFGAFGLMVFYFALYYRSLRLMDRMLANIASGMPEALYLFDAGGRCVWANDPGRALIELRDDFDPAVARLNAMFGAFDALGEDWSIKRTVGAGERAKYYALEQRVVRDDRGRVDGSFLSIRDITAEQKDLQREKYNATHDSLTGLYTRDYMYERVRAAIAQNPDTRYLVTFVDVNDFKLVNDIFGNDFGDYVLQCIADHLCAIMPDDAVYGRFAGDIFAALVPVEDFDAAGVEAGLANFTVNNGAVEYPVLIHMGVYEIAESGLEPSVMFDRAHMALATIKGEYNQHIAYYNDDIRKAALWNQYITSQLGTALYEGQIMPFLQPMVDRDGKVIGAEALVRWKHPAEGFLSPAKFIPVFEKNGMVADVDRYMWRRACEILARWRDAGSDLFISVNISPKDFYFMDVAAEIMGVVREFGVDPSRLRLEITETMMMTGIEQRVGILSALKAAGFIIEMDDFGSGYSSLNLLKDMPVDVLKIDMAFLNRTQDDSRARRILQNIIRMTRDLSIVSLTEGVETEAQYHMLTDMGCGAFQGYYFAKPMPVEEFERVYGA